MDDRQEADHRSARGRRSGNSPTLTHTTALSGLVGNGEELRRTWASLNLSRQHAIVAALIDHVVIGPGNARSPRPWTPSRVNVVWRH